MSQKDDTSQLLAAAFLSSRLHLQALPPGELGPALDASALVMALQFQAKRKSPKGHGRSTSAGLVVNF